MPPTETPSEQKTDLVRNELHRLVGAGLSAFSAIEFQLDMLFTVAVDNAPLQRTLWKQSQFSQQFSYVKAALKSVPPDRISHEEIEAIIALYPSIDRAKAHRDALAHGQVILQGNTGEMFFGPSFLKLIDPKTADLRYRYDVPGLAAVVTEIDTTADRLTQATLPSFTRHTHRMMEAARAAAAAGPK